MKRLYMGIASMLTIYVQISAVNIFPEGAYLWVHSHFCWGYEQAKL